MRFRREPEMKESLALESYEWVDSRDGQYYLAVDVESEDTYETAVRREVLKLAEENARIKAASRELEKAVRALARPLIDASTGSLEGPDIEDLLEKAGLIAWETFSEDNPEQINFLSSEGMYEIEDGDRFWRLTDFGKEFA